MPFMGYNVFPQPTTFVLFKPYSSFKAYKAQK